MQEHLNNSIVFALKTLITHVSNKVDIMSLVSTFPVKVNLVVLLLLVARMLFFYFIFLFFKYSLFKM